LLECCHATTKWQEFYLFIFSKFSNQAGLLFECGAILLVSRSHVTRAFEHLFNEGIQKEDNVSEHQKSQGCKLEFY
jgi:hypothetical protein